MQKQAKLEKVIFHHSLSKTGNVVEIRSWHLAKGWEDIGYHWVITPDGQVEQGRDMHFVGAHAFGRNWNSVGVCVVGDFFLDPPTSEQIEACEGLYHRLCRFANTSLSIEYHRPRWLQNACPGPKFPRSLFSQKLKLADPYRE